jgi:hypothetical protein
MIELSRPCAVKVTRRVVRLRSDTPSCDWGTDASRFVNCHLWKLVSRVCCLISRSA